MPTSAVLATWVPPQSSRETSSTSTTRTHSPYFSPNSAIAPSRSASARSMFSQRTGRLALIHSLTRSSIARSSSGAERLAVGEVEAQLVGPDGGAGLAHVGAEPLAQRRVQEVGRGVVAHRRVARLAVDLGLDRAPGFGSPRRLDLQRLVLADPVDVEDPRLAAVPAQHAGVGDLAAALGVEGALLELDQGAAVVALDRGEAGRRAQRLVADEAGRRRRGGEGDAPLVAVLGAVRGGGADAGALALLLHQLLEAAVVDREALARRAAPWSGRRGSRRCRAA